MPIDGFEAFIISAASAFQRNECGELFDSAKSVITRHYPWAAEVFARRRWMLPGRIDRVHAIDKAQRVLGYCPPYNFESLFDFGERAVG